MLGFEVYEGSINFDMFKKFLFPQSAVEKHATLKKLILRLRAPNCLKNVV